MLARSYSYTAKYYNVKQVTKFFMINGFEFLDVARVGTWILGNQHISSNNRLLDSHDLLHLLANLLFYFCVRLSSLFVEGIRTYLHENFAFIEVAVLVDDSYQYGAVGNQNFSFLLKRY